MPSGRRVRVALEAKGGMTIQVIEERIEERCFVLEASWLARNVIDVRAPASNHKGIQECVKLQGRVDALQADVREREQAAKTLDEEQKRLLKLIPNGHNAQANEWRADLATAEKELREIKRTAVPALKRKLQEAREDLQGALGRLMFAWTEEGAEA